MPQLPFDPTRVRFSIAQADQQPQLRRLWTNTFGDGPAFLDLFFSTCFTPENTVVCTVDGRVCGAFYILECALATPHGPLKAAYNYALAVDAPLRGRGLGGQLLRYLEQVQRARGIQVAVLRPAEPSLFDYYARFGYATRFQVSRRLLAAEVLPAPGPLAIEPLPADRWFGLRGELLERAVPVSLRWGPEMLGYVWRHERFFGGECWALAGGFSGCAVCRPEGETLQVRELLLSRPEEWLAALAALHAHYRASRYELLAPPGCCGGAPLDYSFARWYDPALQQRYGALPGYTGLLLD